MATVTIKLNGICTMPGLIKLNQGLFSITTSSTDIYRLSIGFSSPTKLTISSPDSYFCDSSGGIIGAEITSEIGDNIIRFKSSTAESRTFDVKIENKYNLTKIGASQSFLLNNLNTNLDNASAIINISSISGVSSITRLHAEFGEIRGDISNFLDANTGLNFYRVWQKNDSLLTADLSKFKPNPYSVIWTKGGTYINDLTQFKDSSVTASTTFAINGPADFECNIENLNTISMSGSRQLRLVGLKITGDLSKLSNNINYLVNGDYVESGYTSKIRNRQSRLTYSTTSSSKTRMLLGSDLIFLTETDLDNFLIDNSAKTYDSANTTKILTLKTVSGSYTPTSGALSAISLIKSKVSGIDFKINNITQ